MRAAAEPEIILHTSFAEDPPAPLLSPRKIDQNQVELAVIQQLFECVKKSKEEKQVVVAPGGLLLYSHLL